MVPGVVALTSALGFQAEATPFVWSNAAPPPRAWAGFVLTCVNGPPAYSSEPVCASVNTALLAFGSQGSGAQLPVMLGSIGTAARRFRATVLTVVKLPPMYIVEPTGSSAKTPLLAFGSQLFR